MARRAGSRLPGPGFPPPPTARGPRAGARPPPHTPVSVPHVRAEPSIVRRMPGTFGLRAQKFAILGCDMAGQVEAVGGKVTRVRPGGDRFAARGGGASFPDVRG